MSPCRFLYRFHESLCGPSNGPETFAVEMARSTARAHRIRARPGAGFGGGGMACQFARQGRPPVRAHRGPGARRLGAGPTQARGGGAAGAGRPGPAERRRHPQFPKGRGGLAGRLAGPGHARTRSPNGVVSDIVPRAGYERVIGFNVLKDPAQFPSARAAIQRRAATVAGPLKLYRGEPGIVLRAPIFQRGRDGREGLLGLCGRFDAVDGAAGPSADR